MKYKSIEENPNLINFDGSKSGEHKSVNYSVLSRSKSGDVKIQSNSKGEEKESNNTVAGDCILYTKSKESNGSKNVLIEEIEIPLDEQQEAIENRKTEKNLISKTKSKAISENKSKKQVTSQVYNQSNAKFNDKRYSQEKINSERSTGNKFKESPHDTKRKPSDYIIKKGKVHNLASNNSKSVSPKKQAQSSEEAQSS